MAGHSKWAQIKRQKAKTDAQKGATFSKIAREIIVATKLGGDDVEHNFRLRAAIEKAKEVGFPQENIKRAILKGSGQLESENIEELQYEGYGPGGVAILISALTDNRNRTAGDLRSTFTKYGGNLGETGCVNFLFEKKGLILVNKENIKDIDEILLIAADAGAEDVRESKDFYEVITSPGDIETVETYLKNTKLSIQSSEITYLPLNTVTITDKEIAKKLIKLLDTLDNHDDVQQVYSNADISDELLEV